MVKQAYIIFTRVPVPGKVKTRLLSHLSPEHSAKIQAILLDNIMSWTRELKEDVRIFLAYSNEGNPEQFIGNIPEYITLFPQEGETLGMRMNNAFAYVKNLGYQQILLTGSDLPLLSSETIKAGFQALETNELVIGPTYDGGYYLIGFNGIIQQDILLDNCMSWGNTTVFERTMDIIESKQITAALLEPQLDIDRLEDIEQYLGSAISDKQITSFLRKCLNDAV